MRTVWMLLQGQEHGVARAFPRTAGEDLWAWAGGGMGKKSKSWPLGHVAQCSSSNTPREQKWPGITLQTVWAMPTVSAPGFTTWVRALLSTPWLPFRNILPPCHHAAMHRATLPLCPAIAPASGPPRLPRHRLAHISAGNWQGMVPWSSWLRAPGSKFAPFGRHGGPSLVTHFDSVENLFNTQDLSVTKPAPHPSPTHYTFGIVSYTGANHTEGLEELDSCEGLHNVWYASSSTFLLCSLTARERMSGYNIFPPFPSLHLVLLASLGVTIPLYDSLKAQTPTHLTHCYLSVLPVPGAILRTISLTERIMQFCVFHSHLKKETPPSTSFFQVYHDLFLLFAR